MMSNLRFYQRSQVVEAEWVEVGKILLDEACTRSSGLLSALSIVWLKEILESEGECLHLVLQLRSCLCWGKLLHFFEPVFLQ